MRKALSLIFIFIISLSFIAENVKAEQVEYESFDGLRFYFQDVGQEGPVTVSFNLPSQKCVAGVVVQNDYGDPDELEVKVNGITLSDDNYMSAWPTQEICNDTFDVYVMARTFVVDDFVYHTIEKVGLIVDDEYKKVKSRLLDLKYIPPGAENTAQGLILNKTEVYLQQLHTLPEGSVSFWLKWDGSTNIKISDNIGIDADGYIYIKNDDGTTYALEGVSPPVGTYVPVYIGWRSGEGYIMMNTTKITLNWEGNVTLTKVGSVSQSTSTIIDEFKVWNTYIPPDQILYESQREQYTLLYNNTAIAIKAESGLSLGTIDVAFLDANYNAINSTTLSTGSKTAEVPAGTALVVLSRSGVSRRYYLSNFTEIAFPATEATLVSSKITIRPTTWEYLTLKTADGRVATRIKLDETQSATVMAVYGNDYIITLEKGNTTKAMLYTITGDINLWVESEKTKYSGKYIDAQYNEENDMIVVTYYDASAETQSLELEIRAYDENNNIVYSLYDSITVNTMLYKFSLPVQNDTDVMYYKIKITADGQEFTRTVFGKGGAGVSMFPPNLVPPGLIMFGAAVIGSLMFIAINAYLMPLGALIGLGVIKFLGWADVPPELLGMLGVFSTLALIMYRKDQGVG